MKKKEALSKKRVERVYHWARVFAWTGLVFFIGFFATIMKADVKFGSTLNDLFLEMMFLSLTVAMGLGLLSGLMKERHLRLYKELKHEKAWMVISWFRFGCGFLILIPFIIISIFGMYAFFTR